MKGKQVDYFSYLIMFALFQAVLVFVSAYSYRHRDKLTQMDGMMIGMVLGMFAGLITATLYLIPTGDFLSGFIVGSLVGMGFGVLLGRLGGHLGLLEGVVAGPMGGMMGAMLGQMIRPFSIEVFVPFLMFIFLVTMSALGYMVFDKSRKVADGVAARLFLSWTAPAIIVLLALSVDLPFSISAQEASGGSAIERIAGAATARGDQADNAQKGEIQEIELVAEEAGFSPRTIYAKPDIPVTIKARAMPTAGCVSEILFKDLDVKKIIPLGGATTIELGALKEGVYDFSCPMGMSPGKLIVEGG
jgi:hypothetical protein